MCPKNFRKYREEKFNRNNKPFTAEFLKVQRKKKKIVSLQVLSAIYQREKTVCKFQVVPKFVKFRKTSLETYLLQTKLGKRVIDTMLCTMNGKG